MARMLGACRIPRASALQNYASANLVFKTAEKSFNGTDKNEIEIYQTHKKSQ